MCPDSSLNYGKMKIKRQISKHILCAHNIGLCVVGIASTIGTTAGFSISGAWISVVAGGVLSIPWLFVLAAVIWLRGDMINDHPIKFAILGPLAVVRSYALFGGGLLKDVALSSISSSILYFILVFRTPRLGTV
jgi:hypothetical protein